MKYIKLKEDKGISIVDVIVSMLILCMFVGLISNLFYQIAYYNAFIRMNALAVNYAVTIAEDTDKMKYEEVEETLNETLKATYNLPETFNATIQVKKYSDEDTTKKDIIKIVTIKVEYTFMKENKSYEIKKLKIKEP